MKANRRIRGPGIGVVVGALMLANGAAAVDDAAAQGSPGAATDARNSISFAIDNDALITDKNDEDYSAGFNLTFRGPGVEDQFASLHGPLAWLDRSIGLDRRAPVSPESAQIEYGIYAFTPENLDIAKPLHDDRPYASLIFTASSRQRYPTADAVSWQSTLTLGILGLDIAGDLQEELHSARDSEQPKGWDNQISDGGEPTARYSLARQQLLYKYGSELELKTTLQGSVGYLTEASWGMSLRAGAIHTPWYSFNPELNSYGERPVAADLGKASEHYFWTGFALTARPYNAFLQGQFRDSEVTYDSDEVNIGIVKIWAGYTYLFDNGYSLSYSARAQTSELKHDKGDRSFYWGTLAITRYF